MFVLDLIDTNLQLFSSDACVFSSPGYALWQHGDYQFGQAARTQARLHPRDISTRYWWHLNTDPLQPALGKARHNADLVHAHLLDIYKQAGEPENLILAVPSSMQREQVALLLGIIQSCPFDALGLVSRSVAIAANSCPEQSSWHLELQLHQAVLTRVTRRSGELQQDSVVPLPGRGALSLQEGMVELIADAFISQTRFDPRRKANVEQALYDELPGHLATLLQEPEINIEVAGYRARLSASDLQRSCDDLYRAISDLGVRREDVLLLGPLGSLLPGISRQFYGARTISDLSLTQGIAAHQGKITNDGESLSFITALPAAQLETVESGATTALHTPTHVLYQYHAYPLQPGGTVIGPDGIGLPIPNQHACSIEQQDNDWVLALGSASAEVVKLNGSPATGLPLAAGDTLDFGGGVSVTLIEVE